MFTGELFKYLKTNKLPVLSLCPGMSVLLKKNIRKKDGEDLQFNLSNNQTGIVIGYRKWSTKKNGWGDLCYTAKERDQCNMGIEVEFQVCSLYGHAGEKKPYRYVLRRSGYDDDEFNQYPLIPAITRSIMASQSTSLPYIVMDIRHFNLVTPKQTSLFYLGMSRARSAARIYIEGMDEIQNRVPVRDADDQVSTENNVLTFMNYVDLEMVTYEQGWVSASKLDQDQPILKALNPHIGSLTLNLNIGSTSSSSMKRRRVEEEQSEQGNSKRRTATQVYGQN